MSIQFQQRNKFVQLIRHIIVFYVVGLLAYLLLCLILRDSVWWLAALHNFTPYLFLPLLLLIPLTLALRLCRAVWWQLPLLALAVIWYGPYYLPKHVLSSTGDTIRVVTFNVWGFNPRLGEFEDWLREVDADLVFLQEVPESYGRAGVSNLQDLYPYQVMQSPELRLYGNVTLSKYPVLGSVDIDSEGDGVPTQQRLVLDVNGQRVIAYNVHFMMPMRETPRINLPAAFWTLNIAARYDEGERNAQIDRFLQMLNEETSSVIVAGDFNMSDQVLQYQMVAAHLNDAFRRAGVGLGGSWPVPNVVELPKWLPPVMRIDYIWYADDFQAVDAWVGPRLGSDHLPHVATLEWMR